MYVCVGLDRIMKFLIFSVSKKKHFKKRVFLKWLLGVAGAVPPPPPSLFSLFFYFWHLFPFLWHSTWQTELSQCTNIAATFFVVAIGIKTNGVLGVFGVEASLFLRKLGVFQWLVWQATFPSLSPSENIAFQHGNNTAVLGISQSASDHFLSL